MCTFSPVGTNCKRGRGVHEEIPVYRNFVDGEP